MSKKEVSTSDAAALKITVVGREEERMREMGFLGLVAGVAAAVNGRRERRGEGWREREEREEREEEVVDMAMAGGAARG